MSGNGRNENDAEHSWHMALMAYLLKEYANEKVDIAKVMLMCLIHDIVEIDAGDTYAYDVEAMQTQKAREDAAKERIFSILPDDQKVKLISLFDEFEGNSGGDWKEHGVTSEKIYKRQIKTRLGSEKLFAISDDIIQENIRNGNLEK